MSLRTLVVCPGRGSYGRATLGVLQDRSPAAEAVIDACDAYRAAVDQPLLRDLDAEPAFRGTRHVAGEHASLLTFAGSMADLAELDRERYDVVGVCGNSMGWYTALAASGALPLEDAIELVETMGAYQAGGVIGGQVMTTLVGENGVPDPALRAAVDASLARAAEAGGHAYWSIDLGSHAVLGADEVGLKVLMDTLPKVQIGARVFPTRLPLHSAFHTPLLADTAARARQDLADLRLRAPDVPLIDGRGVVFHSRWASPAELFDYTLGHQVTAPYLFHTGLITALHHCAPEVIVLLGPGNSLGGPVSRAVVREGWGGAVDRPALDARQRSDRPLLLSFGVREQRKALVADA